MRIVMKFRIVEATCNGVVSSIKLESVSDALIFVSVLEKVQAKRDETKLPTNYLEQLRDHLVATGVLNKITFDRKKKVFDRLMFVAKVVQDNMGRVNA